MNVERRPLAAITPYARNPRRNAAAVATVKASLKEYGWQQPIVIDADGVIIVGHTRYLAALELGLQDAPVQVAVELTPAQVKAYRIMDNKSGERAEWDMELLALEVDDLTALGGDLELTGLTDDELANLTGSGAVTEFPELPTGEKMPFQEMTFKLHDDQAAQVKAALERAKAQGPFDDSPNQNSNGNALARVCAAYLSHVG